MFQAILSRIGQSAMNGAEFMGGLSLLGASFVKQLFTRRFPTSTFIEQLYYLGVKTLSLSNLVAVFTGMVLALQFIVGLRRFGLQLYTGQVVGMAIVRELGPVLTALMVASRVGAGIAAELGSMKVSEQILAIEAMGAHPVHKLVVPRILSVLILTPLLTVLADVVGILGGMLVTSLETEVSGRFYLDQVVKTVTFSDFFSGLGKTVFFGFFIGLIACYKGLSAEGGTAGVGQATTKAVVASAMAVFILDYLLTKIFLLF